MQSYALIYFVHFQTFLSDFNGDKMTDLLCVPNEGSRVLVPGEPTGTFSVSNSRKQQMALALSYTEP